VGLVYVDSRGVTRKALIKGVTKGVLFKAKIGNDREVIIGGGRADEGSQIETSDSKEKSEKDAE
jgi:hypothetical protein